MADLHAMGQAARETSYTWQHGQRRRKTTRSLAIADELQAQIDIMLRANELDIAAAREQGLSDALIDRLLLTPARISALVADTRAHCRTSRSGRRRY